MVETHTTKSGRYASIHRRLYIEGQQTPLDTWGWHLPEMLEMAEPLLDKAREHFGCQLLGRSVTWWLASLWNIHGGKEALPLPNLKKEALTRAAHQAIIKMALASQRSRRRKSRR